MNWHSSKGVTCEWWRFAHGTFNFKITLDICCQRFHQQPEDVLLVSFQPCFSVDAGSKLDTRNIYSWLIIAWHQNSSAAFDLRPTNLPLVEPDHIVVLFGFWLIFDLNLKPTCPEWEPSRILICVSVPGRGSLSETIDRKKEFVCNRACATSSG